MRDTEGTVSRGCRAPWGLSHRRTPPLWSLLRRCSRGRRGRGSLRRHARLSLQSAPGAPKLSRRCGGGTPYDVSHWSSPCSRCPFRPSNTCHLHDISTALTSLFSSAQLNTSTAIPLRPSTALYGPLRQYLYGPTMVMHTGGVASTTLKLVNSVKHMRPSSVRAAAR